MHIYWNSSIQYPVSSWTSHEANIPSCAVWIAAVISVKSQLSSTNLFVRGCYKKFYIKLGKNIINTYSDISLKPTVTTVAAGQIFVQLPSKQPKQINTEQ
jgi:hypothetical protein